MTEPSTSIRPKPPNYGTWWEREANDLGWYEDIHHLRPFAHDAFLSWLSDLERVDGPIHSILEVGCGRAVLYADAFASRRYVGFDISERQIRWCREHRLNPRHEYVSGDFIEWRGDEQFDLVFSHAVIDHVYDVNAFMRSVVRASRRWIYVASYRGWFPDQASHRYTWSDDSTCFYNDVSPLELRRVLQELQVEQTRIYPLPGAAAEGIDFETVIVAPTVPGRTHVPRDVDTLRFLAGIARQARALERQNEMLAGDVTRLSAQVERMASALRERR